jgi:hypothetical protein
VPLDPLLSFSPKLNGVVLIVPARLAGDWRKSALIRVFALISGDEGSEEVTCGEEMRCRDFC